MLMLITDCSDSQRWYADKVGEYVLFLGDVGSEYKSIDDGGFVNFVQKEDAEIID